MEPLSFYSKFTLLELALVILGHLMVPATQAIETNGTSTMETRYPVQALDCRSPKRITAALLDQVCSPPPEVKKGGQEVVMILQRIKRRVVPAYRCIKNISKIVMYCGSFSHMKMAEPPAINRFEKIPEKICKDMVMTHTYKTETGDIKKVDINSSVNYRKLVHGSVTRTEDNMACQGVTLTIDGEEHSNMMVYVAATVSVIKVELEVEGNMVADLDHHRSLPTACGTEETCGTALYSYYIEHPPADCEYAKVRTTLMTRTHLRTKEGLKPALSDPHHKILLLVGAKKPAPARCQPYITHFMDTQYPELKMVRRADTTLPNSLFLNDKSEVAAAEINTDLEIRVSLDFLHHHWSEILYHRLQSMGSRLCAINKGQLPLHELSPFHKNSLIRTRGDVVEELECEEVTVELREGEDRHKGLCVKGAFPVYLSGQPLHLLTGTHLVVESADVILEHCANTPAEILLAKGRIFLQAAPVVTRVNLTLDHLDSRLLHLDATEPHSEDEEPTESMLYTKAEIEKLQRYISYGRIRENVVHRMVSDYCENNPDCGSYQPVATSAGVHTFDLSEIQDVLKDPFSWFSEKWSEQTVKVGAYCGLALMTWFVCNFVTKTLCRVHHNWNRKRDYTVQEAMVSVTVKDNKSDDSSHSSADLSSSA